MTYKLIAILLFCCNQVSIAQISVAKGGPFYAKEFSKEISVYRAKTFVINEILGKGSGVTKFEIDALAATNSGELTTVVYRCEEKNKEGLILGFYADIVNAGGVNYQQYAFRDFPINEAKEFIELVEKSVENYSKYIADEDNNIYFTYKDMTILIYNGWAENYKLRIYWNGFDSEWEWSAFSKTKRRMLRKLKQ